MRTILVLRLVRLRARAGMWGISRCVGCVLGLSGRRMGGHRRRRWGSSSVEERRRMRKEEGGLWGSFTLHAFRSRARGSLGRCLRASPKRTRLVGE